MKIFLLPFFLLFGGCALQDINHVKPVFYSTNEFGGSPTFFIGLRFGCTNELYTAEEKTMLMPSMESGSSKSGPKSSGGGCSGGSCSVK